MLNGRPLSLTARNIVRPSNYLALSRAAFVYQKPIEAMGRYLLGRGSYPSSLILRTPLGPQTVTLFCSSDAITVHEIFCRKDYSFSKPPRMVIDLGSNIGISALFFLTRSSSTYCDLYEPDPRNIEKLQSNLTNFQGRFTLHENAVADRTGLLPFSREDTGRYGSLNPDPWVQRKGDMIEVRVEHVNAVLERALTRADMIDVLKIDTEGSELATVRAIDPALRARIRHIVIEWQDHDVTIDGFQTKARCDAVRLSNRRIAANN